ncbi:MAG: hypothetical protein A2X23_09395 [Chloroflexi bacterium GWC2_73_18]|nr:MAG: hypothetical protein A2X23_09395 [Chloroflexi bacterium GWC2_73_18]
MADRPVLELWLGDVLQLRRSHPCGANTWQVVRLGADIGLVCRGCGRRVLIERRRLESRFVRFERRGDQALSAALVPVPRDSERSP